MSNQASLPYIHYIIIIMVLDALLLFVEAAVLPAFSALRQSNLRLWILENVFEYPSWLKIWPSGAIYAAVFFILVVTFTTVSNFNLRYGLLWLFLLHAMIMLIYDPSIFTQVIHLIELILISLSIYTVFEKKEKK
jgi:hypothetical protein